MDGRKVPRMTFLLGGAVGAAVAVPLLWAALLALFAARGEWPAGSAARVLRYAVLFAGLPGFLTGGGVTRLCAHRLAEGVDPGTVRLRHSLVRGAAAMAAGGAGMAILVAVPLGGMPLSPWAWIPFFLAGAAAGAVTGALLGGLVFVRQHAKEPLHDS